MFFLKKLLSQALTPLPFCLSLCFVGLVLLWGSKRQWAGKLFTTLGILLLTAFSFEPFVNLLLEPLEAQYPVYDKTSAHSAQFVVVLGGGHNSDEHIPLSSQLSNESLKRLAEGIRVYRLNPGAKLVLSAGDWLGSSPEADTLWAVAKLMGIPEADMIKERESRDTKDQAVLIKTLVGTNSLILVTSATHMPRAVRLFQAQGLHPISAPAQQLLQRRPIEPATFFPSGRNLNWSEQALHEYVGDVWLFLQGLVGK